nr:hypothetical protein [uncultured Rhodopila sp.]
MIDPAILDKILVLLAPLFIGATGDNARAARSAAQAMLNSYGARTNRELRLAALAVAFSFGALDALSRAASLDLPVNQVLRLRGNANSLNRGAEQNEKRLEKQLQQPAPVALEPAPEPELPANTATDELVAFVRASWKAEKEASATQPVPLSRQQQRFADRQAEKQRQREREQARLAEKAAQRDAAYAKRLQQSA